NLVGDTEQSLDRQAVRGLVGQRRQVVRPGAERDALRPGTELHVLLDPGVQVADHRPDLGHRLAFEREDQPEDAVRRRVLRTHVDNQVLFSVAVGRLANSGDDLVPVLASDVVDATLSFGTHAYDLRSSGGGMVAPRYSTGMPPSGRSEEHTSELQSLTNLVCRLLLEKKNI